MRNQKAISSYLEISTRGLDKSLIDTIILLNLLEDATLANIAVGTDEYRAFQAALEDMLKEPTDDIPAPMVA